MNKTLILGTTAFCGLSIMFVPALAQNTSGLAMTLNVDQKFETGDNLSLNTPPEGNSTFSTTTLRFDLSKTSATDQLDFYIGGALREGSVQSDVATGFVDPIVGLDYSRVGANALFSFGVNYRESDVSFDRSLANFTNSAGVIVLPPDFGSLTGIGTRQVLGFDTEYQTGLNDPIGFMFDANYYATTYQDTPSLDDFERFGFGASLVLRPGQITTGFIDYRYRRFIKDSVGDFDSITNSISLRGRRSVSETTDVTASIGISDVETEEFGVTTSETNPIASIGMVREMVNGTADVSLDFTNTREGQRVTLLFGRSMTLPVDTISYSLGVTDGEGFGANVIGSLNWHRDLPTGRVFANVDRDIQTNNDDEERLATTMSLGYEHSFTVLSSVLLNARYANSDFDNTTSDTEEAELSATYRHRLTEDWNFDTGVSYRVRKEQFIDSVDSTSLFVSFNRDFNWLR